MARTIRDGNTRDGAKGMLGNKPIPWPCHFNRGYRYKRAFVRHGDVLTSDWADCWTSQRENNRVRRAADREATRLALIEYYNDIEDILREWEIEAELEREYLGLPWDDEELY